MTGAVAHEPQAEYDGRAVVLLDGLPDGAGREVTVTLRGAFWPIDGRFHWYGRIAATPLLADVRGGATVRLRTDYGEAEGRLSDVDPWGRLRVSGTGRPPF